MFNTDLEFNSQSFKNNLRTFHNEMDRFQKAKKSAIRPSDNAGSQINSSGGGMILEILLQTPKLKKKNKPSMN